ncbi:hypothetical protein B7R22_06440 [Subtercola boreus]|uniref:Uncharacterized protein n=1 Tax=Subtercola boreus TaxID=120213 RepID=A0A3E0W0A3_9MICO|nr:hypothetical protein [Subtercola boreus]RFA15586.1 hypothetical protein B7R22_06440 [Subtercola boreus]
MQISEASFLHLQASEEQRFTRELELRRLARERFGDQGAPLGPSVLERMIHALGLGAGRRATRRLHAARVIAERRMALRRSSVGGVAPAGRPAEPASAAR